MEQTVLKVLINSPFLAILIATIGVYFLGALWYGPFFGKIWAEKKFGLKTQEEAKAFFSKDKFNLKKTMIITVVAQFFQLLFLSIILQLTQFGGANWIHNFWVTIFVFGAIALAYLVTWIHTQKPSKRVMGIDLGYIFILYIIGYIAITWAYQMAV